MVKIDIDPQCDQPFNIGMIDRLARYEESAVLASVTVKRRMLTAQRLETLAASSSAYLLSPSSSSSAASKELGKGWIGYTMCAKCKKYRSKVQRARNVGPKGKVQEI